MHPQEDIIVKEPHRGVLIDHFNINKTLKILKKYFYWPKMGRDVHKVCNMSHDQESLSSRPLHSSSSSFKALG